MNNLVNVKKITAKSQKTGREYTCYELNIGKYRTRFFCTEIEQLYIDNILKKDAYRSFKSGLDSEEDLDVSADS